MQLALGIGRRSVPAPLAPQGVVEVRARPIMHARARIDEALRPFDQRGEDIGSKGVDGEHMRQSVVGHPMTFLEADGGIVNDRIESAERVDLASDVLGAGDRRQIANDDGFGLGRGLLGVRRSRLVARMQDGADGPDRRDAGRPSNRGRRPNPR